MMDELKEILSNFPIGEVQKVKPFGNGNINRTYVVQSDIPYILQEINTYVFRRPQDVMENMVRVTEFLKGKIDAADGDSSRETVQVIRAKDGAPYVEKNGKAYRMRALISDSVAYEHADTPDVLLEAGACFGKFSRLLADFPAAELHETIPDFHHTPKRFLHLERAVQADAVGRRSSVEAEIREALAAKGEADLVVAAMEEGNVPLRVTHNDTKLNNALLDKNTGKGLCVIDLDTVMPGSLLYDFGEGVRSSITMADEDETDPSKIVLRMDYFKAFAQGFLSEVGTCLSEEEWKLLSFAPYLMTMENAVRFLTDYLEGDPYFGERYPGHNLARCQMHLMLARQLSEHRSEMDELIQSLRK